MDKTVMARLTAGHGQDSDGITAILSQTEEKSQFFPNKSD